MLFARGISRGQYEAGPVQGIVSQLYCNCKFSNVFTYQNDDSFEPEEKMLEKNKKEA